MYNVYAKVYGAHIINVKGSSPNYNINIQDIIKIVNDFIKKDINKHILYSTHRLELFENINDTKLITGELHIPDDDYKINSLNTTCYINYA